METRKLGVVAGFATGAAVAFAPLASAAPTDLIDFDSINASQISTLNSLFELGAQLTGVPDSAYAEAGPGGFLALTPTGIADYAPVLTDPSQAADVTGLEYYLYGVDPIEAGISSDSGAYNVFNGAAIQFADAYNAGLFQLFNPNEAVPADILIGSDSNIAAALLTDNPAIFFYNFAIGDLSGYFQQDLSFLQIPVDNASEAASTFDFSSILDSEISSLNSIFDSGALLTGVPADALDVNAAGFSTVPLEFAPQVTDPADLTAFSYFLYGVNPIDAGIVSDPGSYVVFNGALTEFYDAFNIGLYALFNGGDLVPAADASDFLFGSAGTIADALGDGATVSSAITDFLTNGFADLAGYFDLGAFVPAM
jgi:hypothetical protein